MRREEYCALQPSPTSILVVGDRFIPLTLLERLGTSTKISLTFGRRSRYNFCVLPEKSTGASVGHAHMLLEHGAWSMDDAMHVAVVAQTNGFCESKPKARVRFYSIIVNITS